MIEQVKKETRLAEMQLTKEQAIQMASEGMHKDWTPAERGLFQLRQQLLCMDFGDFHEGLEALLDRPVWTHEFADSDGLYQEYLSGKTISFEDVLAKLPDNWHTKTIVIIKEDRP